MEGASLDQSFDVIKSVASGAPAEYHSWKITRGGEAPDCAGRHAEQFSDVVLAK